MLQHRVLLIIGMLLLPFCRITAQIDTDNVLYMGRSAISADDYLTAIRYFTQVIEAKPFLDKPYYYRAYAKFCLDDFRGAEDDCSKAIERNPYLVEVYQLRGLCRIRNDNFKGATEDYTQALRELPDDQSSFFNRGLCYMELKDYDKASADMSAILKRWPNFYRAFAVKAQISLAQKDTLSGMHWIDSLLELNPENADAWSFKGRFALGKEEYALADSFLTRAINFSPRNYEDYLSRALARHGLNRFGAAIQDYDKTLELVPQHFVAHYNRGLLRALIGDDNRAIEDFSFVIAQEPDNTLAIYNRALLRQQTGDYKGAIADFSRLIAQYPHFVYGYHARSECRRNIGDIKGALNDESVVARAELDLTFGKRTRRPVKHVRKRSDHSLDKYQELVSDEDNDSTGSKFGRLFASDLFGKVQNKKVDRRLLPLFELTFRPAAPEKGYRSIAFLPELASLRQRLPKLLMPSFSAGMESGTDLAADSSMPVKWPQHAALADSLLLSAVIAADAYDYASCLKQLQQAQAAPHDETLEFLIRLQRAAVLFRTYKTGMIVAGGKTVSGNKGTMTSLQIMQEMDAAQKLSPSNQYIVYNRGCLYADLGENEKAEAFFTRAIQMDSRFAEAYFNRGLLRLERADKAGAQADFSRAGELGLYRAYALLKQARL